MSRLVRCLMVSVVVLIQYGCAIPEYKITPIGSAVQQRYEVLFDALKKGEIGINEYSPWHDPVSLAWQNENSVSGVPIPNSYVRPLCAPFMGARDVRILDELLKMGAEMNAPCIRDQSMTLMDWAVMAAGGPMPGADEFFLHLARLGARTATGVTYSEADLPKLRLTYAEREAKRQGEIAEITHKVNQDVARAQQERKEREAEERRQSEMNRQAFVAIAGSAVIGRSMSGREYTDTQRSAVVDGFVQDRVNAANGVKSNNFNSAANNLAPSGGRAGPATNSSVNNGGGATDRWYPSLCATQNINETGAMSRSPYGNPWTNVSRAQQDSKLGRCETREELASRAQAAGTQRMRENGASIIDQRVVCDLGRGGYTVAQYGWVCELWVKAKLPNGRWVDNSLFKSGD